MTAPQDDMIRKHLQVDDGPTVSCLDGETMAAWLDGGLSGAALAAADAHVASCAHCRKLAASVVRHSPAQPVAVPPAAVDEERRGWTWMPWLVPLAAAAVVAVAIWIPRDTEEPVEESTIAAAPETARVVVPPVPVPAPTAEETRQTSPNERETATPAPAPARPAQADRPQDQAAGRIESAMPRPAPPPQASPPLAAPPPAVSSGTAAGVAATPPPPPPPPAPTRLAEPAAPVTVTGAVPATAPDASAAAAPRALAESIVVTIEFESPAIAPRAGAVGAIAGGVAAGGGAGGGGGRGGGGAAGRGGAPAGAPPANAAQPTRWRIVPPATIERANPPGTPWVPVPIAPTGLRLIAGSAPTSLVCWIVGESGLVLRTTDARVRVVPRGD